MLFKKSGKFESFNKHSFNDNINNSKRIVVAMRNNVRQRPTRAKVEQMVNALPAVSLLPADPAFKILL